MDTPLLRRAYEFGREDGRRQGREEGAVLHARSTLVRLMQRKFRTLDAEARARIQRASLDELDRWTEQVLTGQSVEEVLR